MFNTQTFGLKLAQLRKNADMTQSDLGERLNVTRRQHDPLLFHLL